MWFPKPCFKSQPVFLSLLEQPPSGDSAAMNSRYPASSSPQALWVQKRPAQAAVGKSDPHAGLCSFLRSQLCRALQPHLSARGRQLVISSPARVLSNLENKVQREQRVRSADPLMESTLSVVTHVFWGGEGVHR